MCRADGRVVVLGGGDLHPYSISAVEAGGLRELANHNEFLADKTLAPVEAIRLRGADGIEIEGLLVKPLGYQPGQRYPTIVRLHGGPVYQFSHEFMPDWQVYAAHGYAVVAVNPRGSSGRGFDFARAIYADWGNVDVRDVLAGVDHVVAMGIADPQRLGVGGWSYGAHPDQCRDRQRYALQGGDQRRRRFEHVRHVRPRPVHPRVRAGTGHAVGQPRAVRPRQLSVPACGPHHHRRRCSSAPSEDANVPCLGAEQMYQALRSRNVPTRLVVYPGEDHGLTVPSYLRDRMARNLAWYDRFLEGVAVMTGITATAVVRDAVDRLQPSPPPPSPARATSASRSRARRERSTRSPTSPASASARSR